MELVNGLFYLLINITVTLLKLYMLNVFVNERRRTRSVCPLHTFSCSTILPSVTWPEFLLTLLFVRSGGMVLLVSLIFVLDRPVS
jgi:hypothetical protein